MIDGLEWNGAPAPTVEEVRLAETERKYKEEAYHLWEDPEMRVEYIFHVPTSTTSIFLLAITFLSSIINSLLFIKITIYSFF